MRFRRAKRGALCALVAITGGIGAWGRRQMAPPLPTTPLPIGKFLLPQGQQTEVGSFPANIALSPDGRWLAVTNTGFRQNLSLLSTTDGKLVSQLSFDTPKPDTKEKPALYVGLAFGPASAGTETLYVSHGPEDRVGVYTIGADGTLSATGRALDSPSALPAAAKAARPNFIAGIALSTDGTRCYAVNNQTSAWTKYKGSVSILDTAGNRVLGHVVTPGFPFAVAAITRGANADKKIYVSSERDGVVSAIDVSDPARPKILSDIKTGMNPMALALDRLQNRLFVANAGSDTVTVLDTATDRVIGTISLQFAGTRGLPGATPTGLALSPDDRHLYVSLGERNAVAVIQIGAPTGKEGVSAYTMEGAIPVGWYPTAVTVSRDGGRLFVANAKGVRARNANKTGAGPEGRWGQYIENILEGTVSTLPVPSQDDLRRLSDIVSRTNLPPTVGKVFLPTSGIKHVFYVIKENRTYDQVLGDLKQGDGDPSMVLFGRDVTPNQHVLAERFVLLDNFYDCAEVSADGWNWSTSGMTGEYTARNVHFNYSRRGRSYDFEGTNNDAPVDLLGLPDVARAPGGYLWDQCAKQRVSYRAYGFFNAFDDLKDPSGKLLAKANMPVVKALVGHTDEEFLRFDMSYADSDAWVKYQAPAPKQKRAYGKFNAASRFAEWKREFDAFVQNGNLPQLNLIRFCRDHTQGTTPDLQSPRGMVADNDYAVGQLVEAVSHSPYWKESVIFLIEDDAQDGHDHIDAHRSLCFVVSPYVRRAKVDHQFYNTNSVLHTIEGLLGVPPMCQYDATAPLFDIFAAAPDNAEPYVALLPEKAIIGEVNQKTAYRARDSQHLDFTRADRVPEATLNDILWHSVKGTHAPEPLPRHTVVLVSEGQEDAGKQGDGKESTGKKDAGKEAAGKSDKAHLPAHRDRDD